MTLDTDSSHSAQQDQYPSLPVKTLKLGYSPEIPQFKSCSGNQNQPCLMPDILFSNSSPSATSRVSRRFLERRREVAIGSRTPEAYQDHLRCLAVSGKLWPQTGFPENAWSVALQRPLLSSVFWPEREIVCHLDGVHISTCPEYTEAQGVHTASS